MRWGQDNFIIDVDPDIPLHEVPGFLYQEITPCSLDTDFAEDRLRKVVAVILGMPQHESEVHQN